jgi:hypothetical protein
LGRFARKGEKRPGTLHFTTLGVARHGQVLHGRTRHARKGTGPKSKVARDGQAAPSR